MQHTLIPTRERQRLHREYFIRVTIVFLFVMCLAILVGVAALFPTYIKTWLSYNAAQNVLTDSKRKISDTNITQITKELSRDAELVNALSVLSESLRYSDVVRSLISVRGTVTLISFKLERAGKRAVSINLSGIAPKREDLLSFKGRLESLVPGTTIELPISQLAKNTNIPFSFRFTQQLP